MRATPERYQFALKEWAAVVRALERGRQDVLLRKGGIAEPGAGFQVEHHEFLLFPTYFHQQMSGIRQEHAALLDEALAARPPEARVIVRSWAEVLDAREVETEAELDLLEPRHVLRRDVVHARFDGAWGKSLYAMTIRVHLLDTPLDLPMLAAYGGCKSWVELEG